MPRLYGVVVITFPLHGKGHGFETHYDLAVLLTPPHENLENDLTSGFNLLQNVSVDLDPP